jgi:hypothetical protein
MNRILHSACRARFGLALFGFAVGCSGSSAYDGTYQVKLKLKDWECNDDALAPYPANYEATSSGVMSVYHTKEGTVVFDMGSSILTGTRDGTTFIAAHDYASEDQACGTESIENSATLTGEFTKDLGMLAQLQSATEVQRSGCKGTTDYDLTCEEEWEITGFRINNTPGIDPNDAESGANWGYVPGWSY